MSRLSRLVAAELLAVVVLFLSAYYSARYFDPALPNLAKGTSIAAIILAAASFVLSFRVRSSSIAGLLVSSGVIILVPPLDAIAEAGVVAVPGPILGVVFFIPILFLGLAKTIGLMTRVKKERTPTGGYSVAVSTTALALLNGSTQSAASAPWQGGWSHWGGVYWWWVFWPTLAVAAFVVVAVLVFLAARAVAGWRGAPQALGDGPARIIKERHARGELTKEQYEQRKRDLG